MHSCNSITPGDKIMSHPIKDAVDTIFADENRSLSERETEARTYLCNTAFNVLSKNMPWSFTHGEYTVIVNGVSVVRNNLYLNVSCKDGQGNEKIPDPHFFWNSVIFLIPDESGNIVIETTDFAENVVRQNYKEDIINGMKIMLINAIAIYING